MKNGMKAATLESKFPILSVEHDCIISKDDDIKEDLSFPSRSFERHFNERPYLKHTCYLFLTKTTKEHSRTTSSFNCCISRSCYLKNLPLSN